MLLDRRRHECGQQHDEDREDHPEHDDARAAARRWRRRRTPRRLSRGARLAGDGRRTVARWRRALRHDLGAAGRGARPWWRRMDPATWERARSGGPAGRTRARPGRSPRAGPRQRERRRSATGRRATSRGIGRRARARSAGCPRATVAGRLPHAASRSRSGCRPRRVGGRTGTDRPRHPARRCPMPVSRPRPTPVPARCTTPCRAPIRPRSAGFRRPTARCRSRSAPACRSGARAGSPASRPGARCPCHGRPADASAAWAISDIVRAGVSRPTRVSVLESASPSTYSMTR